MENVRFFKERVIQPMVEWHPEYPMEGVSVSDLDMANGSPKAGDFIATNPVNPSEKWLVAAKFIAYNYEEVFEFSVDAQG